MKHFISLTIALFITIISFSQNNDAAKNLLDKVSETISSYNDIYIDFEYKLENKAADVEQINNGNLTLKGDKYKLEFFGTIQIFDGLKTYTIIPENEEVNISSSTDDNENTLTPSKFYSFYIKGYTYNLDKKKQIKGKDIQFIKLIPIDSNSEVEKILIGVATKTNFIYTIIEYGKNETQTILTVKKYVTNQNIAENTFVFDRKKYESLGYTIND